MLVTLLNFPADHYTIVPMLREGRTTLLLILDAYDGSYRESAPTIPDQPGSLNAAQARLDTIMRKGVLHTEGGGGQAVPVWPSTSGVFPGLTWRPCLESLSPYLPFLQLHTGNRRIHIRLDGTVFGEISIRFSGA